MTGLFKRIFKFSVKPIKQPKGFFIAQSTKIDKMHPQEQKIKNLWENNGKNKQISKLFGIV